jgi:DNA primase
MAIPQSFIQELIARTDVVEVVGQHVQLKRGGANFMGLCPFHDEKSPSFTVSPSKQFFHCFGCGKHGNAIGFLMELAGLGFVDAVKELAQRQGMEVPEDRTTPEQRARQAEAKALSEQLSDLLAKAGEAYRKQLKTAPVAIDYLKGRGLTGQIAKRFGLGYAPPGWRHLASVFPDYTDERLVQAGLVIHQAEGEEDKRYDRFRDRIMFPIRGIKGDVIGFGGRVMGNDTPKYLNSPETPVFSKGRELYGLFEAKEAIRDAGLVLVTEGYMDVVALAQWGFANAVATLGTACTADHVQKLFRHTDTVVFAFDGDAAGRRAARRALEAALPHAQDTRQAKFLFLPTEHDPDSYIREHGPEAFARLLSAATPLSRWVMEVSREGCDLDTAEGRSLMARQAQDLWLAMPNSILKTQLLHEWAQAAQLGTHELQALWEGPSGGPGRGRSDAPYAKASRNRPERGQPRASGGSTAWTPSQPTRAHRQGQTQRLREDRALVLLFSDAAAWDGLSESQRSLLCELPAPHGELFQWLDTQMHDLGPQPLAALLIGVAEHAHGAWLTRLVEQTPSNLDNDRQELDSILLEIEKQDLESVLASLAQRAATDPEAFARFKLLDQRRKVLKKPSTPVDSV